MKSLTPLQHSAQELRESFKRAEEDKQKKQEDKLEIEGRALVSKFAGSFSTLYSLLIGSDVQVDADRNAVYSIIILTCNGNQVSINLDRTNGMINSWSLFDKAYKATMPNKNFGMAADREDEQRLIIAIEEILFSAKPKVTEQRIHQFQVNETTY